MGPKGRVQKTSSAQTETMKRSDIDNGNEFDWSKTALDYALYRDIYPQSLYEMLHLFGIARTNTRHLDIGTGSGVIPIRMYKFGAELTGVDISGRQIESAREWSLKLGLDIQWRASPAEDTGLPGGTFDSVSAVQCWPYFDRKKVLCEVQRVLKNSGLFAIVFMGWLPEEDFLTRKSLQLVSAYNPEWKSGGSRRHVFSLPDWLPDNFRLESYHTYDEGIPFTYESWTGRLRACRGVGASLEEEKVRAFSEEHMSMLIDESVPHEFHVPHQIVMYVYRVL